MKVTLAGFNIDVEILNEIKDKCESISKNLESRSVNDLPVKELRQIAERAGRSALEVSLKDNLTPEVLSAAYARISRSPQPISEIRRSAREGISRARRSNQQIIFGLGHKSVAEHAVFNLDITEISRLATEFVQANRLCSFTEKSQRYIRFKEEVYLPPELVDSPFHQQYQDIIHQQFTCYGQLFSAIYEHLLKENPHCASDEQAKKHLENLAGEDARYVLPLATYTQLGMTLNARSLEWMALKASAHSLREVRDFGKELQRFAWKYTPSLVKYTEASEDFRTTGDRIRGYLHPIVTSDSKGVGKKVRLLAFPENGDDRLLAMLLFSQSSTPWESCLAAVATFDQAKKESLFRDAMKGITVHDPVWREFEALNFDFELILSASAYAQLKRHRMSCQLLQPYHPELGIVIPKSIKEIGLQSIFETTILSAETLYHQLQNEGFSIGEYILTNSHCHRVLLHVNARELYHIARLRMDHTAQWEIRDLATAMLAEASQRCPLTFALATGKDNFQEAYSHLFAKQV